MKPFTTIAVSIAAAALLAGCAGMELDRARGVEPKGSEFSKNLYKGYLSLATSEQSESDFGDADAFALRAISAAGGQEFGPEALAARRLPADKMGELGAARARLMSGLAAGARTKAPEDAAHAQVMFDCWMQEQEENVQPPDIARCRGEFMAAMTKVENAVKPAPVAAMAPPPKPMAPAPASKMMKQNFVVYFPFDSAKITPQSKRILADAIAAAKSMNAKRVFIKGHADRAGADKYNAALSERRTNMVAGELTGGGLSPRILSLGSFGESLPAVKTDDNVKSQENRRVEIEISN